ncbi:geranylgeranyl pyrophosphate synthetase [Gonapodya prolifera JEL478]|uniref:Geranylgeranyl pyrophosphate synthetase n=1 Tax=Gonapodya prolifera (strain JEL478) TaxID=1344416 RepID=A0A139AA75_GONPJ|nr:geranylgeranyl pyrophosphate synthetase [Gonapodya prolifera JEL478]|eukprot:KXS13589.1 geranylgeranyl pyrophosphate synthetase [Gonapodya prolifera JEL478]
MADSSAISREQILLEPFHYLTQHSGKELRSRLIEAFDFWLKVPKDKLDVVKSAIEMLHTASLLIDDVEDNSELRRGVPVTHKIFGVASTINSGNYVYFLALEKILKLQCPHAVEIFTEELLNLHRGQGMEIYWRETGTCPTEEEYMEMVSNKTGGLLRLAVKLMQALSSSTVDYVPLVDVIGVYYQVRDDYLNLQSTQYAENKGFAEDLTEGKFSFPVIHCIRTDPQNRQMLSILKKRTTDVSVKRYAVDELLQRTHSFEYTIKRLKVLEAESRDQISRLGGNRSLETVLDYLSKDYVVPPVE